MERREVRLAAIAEAKAQIEARAAERTAREQGEYEAKLAAREQKRQRSGKKPSGRPPAPPVAGPREKDQINLTDADSPIMKTHKGLEQRYNAQAAVDTPSMLVVGHHLTQAGNDKQQVTPMLERLKALPQELGEVTQLLADTGYCSQDNVVATQQADIEPLIALGRKAHNQPWQEQFIDPPPPEGELGALEAMAYRLKTQEGRTLYALRKQTVEPVFGIVKSVMGFRQFLLRGVDKTRGEWSLVTTRWNIKRMFAL